MLSFLWIVDIIPKRQLLTALALPHHNTQISCLAIPLLTSWSNLFFFLVKKKRVPSGQVETNVDSSTAWGRKSQLLVRWQPQLAEQTPDLDKNKRFVVSEHVFLPSIYGYVNRIIGKMMGKTMKFGGIIFSDKPTWSEIYNLIWSIVDMYYGAFVWWNLVVFELIPSSYY